MTNSTSGSGFLNLTYNSVPTAASPAPNVITALQFGKGAIIQKRRGGGLNLEYKLTPSLTLALRGQANWEDARNYNKNFAITGTRPTLGAGSNDLVFIGTPTATNTNRFNLAGGLTHRILNTHSFSPQFFYTGQKLSLDGTIAYTRLGEHRENLRAKGPMHDEVGSAIHQREVIYAQRTMDAKNWPETTSIVMQTFRIGGLGVAAVPFETFTETGLEIKAKSPFKDTFTIELANGSYGYLPTPEQHELGGYETWLGTNRVEQEASRKIMVKLMELFNEVKP